MAKYKVIALSVSGLNNRIYNSQDIVDDSCFPDGHAPILVKDGFIAPITEDQIVKHTITQQDLDNNPELVDEGVELGEVIELPADKTLTPEEEQEELKEEAKKRNKKQ